MVCLVPLIWQRPVIATYVLIAGAAIFETFRLHFPDSLTDQTPFFQSFVSLGGPYWLPISGAEFILLVALVTIALKNLSIRAKPIKGGPLFAGAALLGVMTLFGLVYGIASGGNTSIALWEARPALYLFLAYLIAFNTINKRAHVKAVVWIFLIAVALKGVLGSIRFMLVLGGDLSRIRDYTSYNSMMAHEESFFFCLFLALLAILYLFRAEKRQFQFAAIFSPFVILSLLANERRGGTLYLALMAIIIAIFAYKLLPERRKLISVMAFILIVLMPAYIIGVGGRGGLIAQPARAIVSVFQPNTRDASSNEYRDIENENIKENIALAPITGQGFGKPMVQFQVLPDISDRFIYWDIIPHDTVLWVWMRLGFIGFVALFFLLGRTIVEAAMASRYMKSPYLKGLGIFIVAALAGWVAIGALDMGLANLRLSILVGVLVAVAARFRTLTQTDKDSNNSLESRVISYR